MPALDLATDVAIPYSGASTYSGGAYVPSSGTLVEIALRIPVLAAGQTITLSITGTFAPRMSIFAGIDPDDIYGGGNHSLYNDTGGSTTEATGTFDFIIGTGLESYDAAIAASQNYIDIQFFVATEITAISYVINADYADVLERFETGPSGDTITTSNTTFPRVEPYGDGPAVFATGGASGLAAAPDAGGAGQFPGSDFYDTDVGDSTSTITAVDWTARAKFKITDPTSTPDTGYTLLQVYVGEVGRTPADWASGAQQAVTFYYDFGTKELYFSGPGGAGTHVDVSGDLDTWLDLILTGTNGSVNWVIANASGAEMGSGSDTLTADLYRARAQVNVYRDGTAGVSWSLDDVFIGATANDPFSTGAPVGVFGDPGPGAVYFGLNILDIDAREAHFGHRMGVCRSYWNNSSGSTAAAVAQVSDDLAAGRVAWPSFKLTNSTADPDWTWAQFAAGDGDTWFAALLAALDAIGAGPILLTLHHEPVGDGDAADYLAMYEHAKTMTDAYPRILLTPVLNASKFYQTAPGGPHIAFADYMSATSADVFGYDIYMIAEPGGTFDSWATNSAGLRAQLDAIDPDKPQAIGEWGLHTWPAAPSFTTTYMQDLYDYALEKCYAIAYFDSTADLNTALDAPGPTDGETGPPWVRLNKFGSLLADPGSIFIPPGGLIDGGVGGGGGGGGSHTQLATAVSLAGDIPTYEEVDLIIADPDQYRAPTSVQVMFNGAVPGEEITFKIDARDEEIWSADADTNGSLFLVSVPIPPEIGDILVDGVTLDAGTHTLHATTAGGRTASDTFTLQLDATTWPALQSADVDAVEVPGRGKSWALQDPKPGGLGSWVLHPSPTSMSEPEFSKTVDVEHTTNPMDGRYHVAVGEEMVKEWSWSGYCPDQTFYEQMEAYAALNRRIWVLDHRNRAWKATIVRFDPTLRKRQIEDDGTPQDWAADYVVSAVVYDRVWMTPVTP